MAGMREKAAAESVSCRKGRRSLEETQAKPLFFLPASSSLSFLLRGSLGLEGGERSPTPSLCRSPQGRRVRGGSSSACESPLLSSSGCNLFWPISLLAVSNGCGENVRPDVVPFFTPLQDVSGFQRILSTLTLAIFPVLYFFTFLYYTDTGSAFFTLFSYLMCLYGHHKTSALLGLCGFMFRQTNIVWTVFCGGNVVAQKLSDAWKTELVKNKEEKISPERGSFSELSRVFWFLTKYLVSPRNVAALIFLTWPYLMVVMVFLAFVVLNNGIVVGDRTNHEASLNFPQLFYFFSFTLLFSFPHLLSVSKITRFRQSVRRNWLLYGLLTTISLFLVWKFTYVHKYLLADNRHYTFYVWRKIFQRHESVKYILIPVYVFAGWSFIDSLKSKSVFWSLSYFLCVSVATVPQKLLEFRYFILPYIIYRLNIPMPSLSKLFLEFFFYLLVNAVTFYLFLNKPFQWPNSSEIQRFMW